MTTEQPRPAEPSEDEIFSRLGNAMALQRAGSLHQAELMYHAILSEVPGQADALHMLGLVAHQRGQYGEAINLIRQAIDRAPEFPDAYNSLGIVLKRVGETEEAVAAYRRAIGLRPDYPEAHRNLSLALHRLGRLDEAEEALKARLGLRPDNADAYVDLGFLHHKRGQVDDAAAAFRRAIELDPANINARRNLWISLSRGGRTEQAEAALREWQKADPENPVAQHMAAAFNGESPERASDGYVQSLFDLMGPSFDTTLADLGYRAPELVTAALAAVAGPPEKKFDLLDAGCGTGLCGPLLQPYARTLTGVDLSAVMLNLADERDCYDGLVKGELTNFLLQHPKAWDAIVSADTLCYFGDLKPVLEAAAFGMAPDSWLVFTVEAADEPETEYRLSRNGRYVHGEAYVRRTLHEVGLKLRAIAFDILRLEGGQPVNGLVVTAGLPVRENRPAAA